MKRFFLPGSEWVYIKLYTSECSSNKILLRIYSLLNQSKLLHTIISKFFFIRYNDPNHHIRIRFLLTNNSEIGHLLATLQPLFEKMEIKKEIWKVQIDTYFRELERYGANQIESFETMFYFDSICTIKIISLTPKAFEDSWLYSLLIVDSLLSDFNLCIQDKCDLMLNLSENLKISYNYTIYNRKQLNELYRSNRNKISSILNLRDSNNDNEIVKIINERSKSNIKLITSSKLNDIDYNGSELASCIHMSINRYYKTSNNIFELIIYDFLYRYYSSSTARIRIK